MSQPELTHTPVIPYDPSLRMFSVLFGVAYPFEFDGWKNEVMSWKESAYLHGGLNPIPTYRISGPDALRLLSEHCVNSFARFTIGGTKHAIMCDDKGRVMAHGIVVRESDDTFITYSLMPWIDHLADSGEYDVKGENLTGRVFLFQLAGPRSLEILEAAFGEDLHDIRFLHRRASTGAVSVSQDLDVLRVGMAGSLAYEVHGPIEKAHEVWDTLVAAGAPFGLQRLGAGQYEMNHTENGFPQGHIHFLHPWFEDPALAQRLMSYGSGGGQKLRGSAGNDYSLRYRTPYELGWGHIVSFDHEFQGRAALEAEAASPRRTMVTLVWNRDDILKTFASHFDDGEEYPFMNFTKEHYYRTAGDQFSDLVVKDGATIGISSGRTYSYYYRKMLSLCSIDVAYAGIGTEVSVIWGEPGGRQLEIRATVERFPFYNENRNETVDTNLIPRPAVA